MITSKKARKAHIINDIFIIVLSIIVTIILVRTGAMDRLVSSTQSLGILGSFIAGIFFTSIFTITPAGVALAFLTQTEPLLQVAVVGAAGAVIGDLLIFLFIKDTFAPDVIYLVHHVKSATLRSLLRLKLWRWLTPLLGAIVIASPLPDELGLAMMGLARTSPFVLIPISFTFNFIGIILIALALG